MEQREVTLPSGAKLKLHAADFATSKALRQVCMAELGDLGMRSGDQLENTIKNIVCLSLSSLKIEAAIKKCMEKALIDGARIDDKTFEPLERRRDYDTVCYEVAKENLAPFLKDLYALFLRASAEMNELLA